ncbi:MAG: glycosyltransferase family 2 protein [Dehalococcoidia bacterium]|nr:glycosyltransferase family 2 protein [Dehalococcoidia bacterium]
MQSWPLVSVVILNWNGLRHLRYCLPSVLATDYPRCQVIVVDNASSDGSCAYVQSSFPGVVLLRNAKNLGWSGGNNVGIRYAMAQGARYVVLLNNDMKVHPRWLTKAVAAAEADPHAGVVGFHVFGEYGKEPIERFEQACRDWQPAQPQPATHVGGCAMFIPTDMLRAIGLVDDAYFAYGEEDDLEARARRAGFALTRVNVPLWHYSEGSSERIPWKASILTMRNRIRYLIKNESLGVILRQVALVVHISCNPFARTSRGFAYHRRLRPSNVLVNAGLLAYALGWNLVHLPQTLAARRWDNQAIASYLRTTATAPESGRLPTQAPPP